MEEGMRNDSRLQGTGGQECDQQCLCLWCVLEELVCPQRRERKLASSSQAFSCLPRTAEAGLVTVYLSTTWLCEQGLQSIKADGSCSWSTNEHTWSVS